MPYIFDTIPEIKLPSKADNNVIEELLSNYTYGRRWKVSLSREDNCITIGKATKTDIISEYVVNITNEGIYIGGRDYNSVMRGFLTFLEKIKYCEKEDCFYVDNGCIAEKAFLPFRGVHLCVFPETKTDFLKKCVRACAIAKFSHIILEFWGMIKFDCMKELSWDFAYGKKEIKNIVCEANALGVEIIPMFNHIGHASACREINGKHVVLDQNPKYEYMFESYGWVWNFEREDVRNLHKKIRDELTEVCGEGKYFHIGCDEVYSYGHNTEKAFEMCKYLNYLSKELCSAGRRPVMWHDMLLAHEDFDGYIATSEKKVSEILMKNLDRNFIIADWQYSCHGEKWRTSQKLKENGFDVLCCPWDNAANINEAIDTAKGEKLYGIIHTTWHTLHRGFREMVYAGKASFDINDNEKNDILKFYCASVARKVLPAAGVFEKSGWSDKMTGAGLV